MTHLFSRRSLPATLAILLGLTAAAAPLAAQYSSSSNQYSSSPKFFVEGLAGAAIPTFDIANTVKTGSVFGGAVGVQLNPKWVLMGEFDYGTHKDKATGLVDIKTLHYIAKVGYMLTEQSDHGWEAVVNLGAGAMGFKIGPSGTSTTKMYFAINAGAKITYNFSRSVGFVLSPQGDIAFTKTADLNTTNAWVWPVTAGIRIRY